MHVGWGVLEGVVEALFLYWAGGADLSCCLYVGDVFVVLGEHVVGLAFAGCFFCPQVVVDVCCVYFGVFGCFGVFFVDFAERVGHCVCVWVWMGGLV